MYVYEENVHVPLAFYNPILFYTLMPQGWETGVMPRKPSNQVFADVVM